MDKKILIAGVAGALLFGAAAIAQTPNYDNNAQSAPAAGQDTAATTPSTDDAATDTAGTEMDRAGERG